MSVPTFLACTHPVAALTAVALIMVAFLLRVRRPRIPFWPWMTLLMLLAAGALWMGRYGLAPASRLSSPPGLVAGFVVTKPHQPPAVLGSRALLTLASGSVVAIHPELPFGPITCIWMSSRGGSLDEPHSCDVVYSPPLTSTFDVLKLRVQSGCTDRSEATAINVSVLP